MTDTNPSMDSGLPEYAYSNDFSGSQANSGGGDDANIDDPDPTPNRADDGDKQPGPAVFLDFAAPPPRIEEDEEEEKKPYYVIGGGD